MLSKQTNVVILWPRENFRGILIKFFFVVKSCCDFCGSKKKNQRLVRIEFGKSFCAFKSECVNKILVKRIPKSFSIWRKSIVFCYNAKSYTITMDFKINLNEINIRVVNSRSCGGCEKRASYELSKLDRNW